MFVNGGTEVGGDSSESGFGFQNMNGPQIFPSIRKAFGKYGVAAYLKFSPVSQSGIPTFASNEIAGGLSFGMPIGKEGSGKSMSFSLDIASLSIDIDKTVPLPDGSGSANSRLLAKSDTVSLSFGFRF
jgi:hypothetical protein